MIRIDHDEPAWLSLYTPRRLLVDDTRGPMGYMLDRSFSVPKDQLMLFRYMRDRFEDPIRRGSYWSEANTDISRFAGEATGIPDFLCVWRAEWTISRAEAKVLIRAGQQRRSLVGPFVEYQNIRPVAQDQFCWHLMEPDTNEAASR